ncbi:hypothetical protein BC629DRAFT_854839 [Irpex lacteus]|nr:hypothetical protein BC629DRAFT_854839 [Irpex lacteus]
MSSSGRNTLHRRRSHSASSPLASIRQCTGDKWRPSYKRARPGSTRSASQRDVASDGSVEGQRDSKRVRRGSWSPVNGSKAPGFSGSSPLFRGQRACDTPSYLPTTLPCTADAFALYPRQQRQSQWPLSCSDPQEAAHHASSATATETPTELMQLRSNAFWELQRSIAENGEGMVTRMRDWEETHAHEPMKPEERDADTSGQLNLMKRPSFSSANSDSFDEDEDEVQIIEAGSPVKSPTLLPSLFSHSHRNETRPASGMDMDCEGELNSIGADSISSPEDDSPYLSSTCISDEDSPSSLTLTESSNSSLASLPLHSYPPISIPEECSLSTTGVPTCASPSEKAIAALTLVMANGAGSLNDYEAVRTLEEPHIASLDDPFVGEMWH